MPTSDSAGAPFAIKLTQEAIDRVLTLQAKKQEAEPASQHSLRVFVDAGGCSGFTYNFEMVADEELDGEKDYVFVA